MVVGPRDGLYSLTTVVDLSPPHSGFPTWAVVNMGVSTVELANMGMVDVGVSTGPS